MSETDSQRKSVRGCRDCHTEFASIYFDQLLCWKCRTKQLAKEVHRFYGNLGGTDAEALRPSWDYRVIDENGIEVWAKDLAYKYRRELERRQARDFKRADPNKKRRKRHGKNGQDPPPLASL